MKKELVKPISIALKVLFWILIVFAGVGLFVALAETIRTSEPVYFIAGIFSAGLVVLLAYFIFYKAALFYGKLIGLEENETISYKQKIANWSVCFLFFCLPLAAVMLIYYCSIPIE